MSKYKDGDLITTLLPHDPEEFYDIPESELPKYVGVMHMKYNSIFDGPVTIQNGNKPIENYKLVFIDISKDEEK